jgi:hypothetical protein
MVAVSRIAVAKRLNPGPDLRGMARLDRLRHRPGRRVGARKKRTTARVPKVLVR